MEGVRQVMCLSKCRLLNSVFLAAVGAACIAPLDIQSRAAEHAGKLKRLRVPNGGIQPQVVVDGKGVLHMLYYHGDPRHGDIFYVRSSNAGAAFSRPLRVNSEQASAIAIGNIRGAHFAVGKGGRVHVAWNDSRKMGSSGGEVMSYTRLNDK